MRFKQKYFIDSHKGLTPIFILLLINCFNAWDNIEAILYLALHGTYGALWVTKSFIYPDKQWEGKTPLWYGLVIWVILSLYWISPYIITTNRHFLPIDVTQNSLYIGFCITIYIFGIFWLGILIGWNKPILQLGVTPFLFAELFKILLLTFLAKKILSFRKFI